MPNDTDRDDHPVYFDLTSDAITPVPDSAGESFRRAAFQYRLPIYAGVSLSFDEASESPTTPSKSFSTW